MYKDGLEQIISERTKDIARTNEELRLEIINRQKIARALQENENKLKKVLNTLPIGVWFTDKNGKIVYGNPAAQKIFGFKRDFFHESQSLTFQNTQVNLQMPHAICCLNLLMSSIENKKHCRISIWPY